MATKRKKVDSPHENGSHGSLEIGNTSQSPEVKKRVSPGQFWSFTWNLQMVPMDHDYSDFEAPFNFVEFFQERGATKVAIQLERGEKGECENNEGRLHWQGCIEIDHKIRPVTYFKLDKKIHWSKTKFRNNALQYCCKDRTAILPERYRYLYNVIKIRPLMKIKFEILRPWQKALAVKYINYAAWTDRKIHWYWEATGGIGKTIMCKYFVDQCHAIILGGKADNCKYGVQQYVATNNQGPPIIVINVPRASLGYISYTAIEEVKDAIFFSGKYEGGMVRYNTPHVIVFANEPPDTSKMSPDRWVIHELPVAPAAL